MIDDAHRAGRVIFPAHNYKHAPVIRAVRRALDRGDIGGAPGDVAHLPQHARARRRRVARELAPRAALLGRRHRHGPREPHLLPRLRLDGGVPHRDHREDVVPSGFDTEDTVSATVTFPTGIANVHLTWTAGVRRVIYTLHGERGTIRVEDDAVEVSVMVPRRTRRRRRAGRRARSTSARAGWTRATPGGSRRCSASSTTRSSGVTSSASGRRGGALRGAHRGGLHVRRRRVAARSRCRARCTRCSRKG